MNGLVDRWVLTNLRTFSVATLKQNLLDLILHIFKGVLEVVLRCFCLCELVAQFADHLLVVRVAQLLIHFCILNHTALLLRVAEVESVVVFQLLGAWIFGHMLDLVVAKKRLSA